MADLFTQEDHTPVKSKGRKKIEESLQERVTKFRCNCPLVESETMIKNKDLLGNPSINYQNKEMWYCRTHQSERVAS